MAGKIVGSVVSFTEAGNLVTDITAEQLANVPRDQSVTVVCDEHETTGIFGPDHDQPEMTYIALVSDDRLELAIVGDSAKIMLGAPRGTPVVVKW